MLMMTVLACLFTIAIAPVASADDPATAAKLDQMQKQIDALKAAQVNKAPEAAKEKPAGFSYG
ncbi:MAG: hypothetical protein ACXVID_04500, partial [Thermoanaerobaculia bacterium]